MKLSNWCLLIGIISILLLGCQPQQVVEKSADPRSLVEAVVHTSSQGLGKILRTQTDSTQCQMIRDYCKDTRFLADESGYLMVYDMKGNCIAHGTRPEIQGLNRMDHQDSKGNFNIQAMVKTAQEAGSGWVSYYYQNPTNGTDMQKHSYVERIPGTHYWAAAGYYEK